MLDLLSDLLLLLLELVSPFKSKCLFEELKLKLVVLKKDVFVLINELLVVEISSLCLLKMLWIFFFGI